MLLYPIKKLFTSQKKKKKIKSLVFNIFYITLLVPAVNSLCMWLTKIHRDSWTSVNEILLAHKITK